MRPVQHPSSNDFLMPPPGREKEVQPVAITRVMLQPTNVPTVRTFWEPSPAERAAIAAGKPIALSVWGMTMPPVMVGVDGVEPFA